MPGRSFPLDLDRLYARASGGSVDAFHALEEALACRLARKAGVNPATFRGQRIAEEVQEACVHVFSNPLEFPSPRQAIAYVLRRAAARALARKDGPLCLPVDEDGNHPLPSLADRIGEVEEADEVHVFEGTLEHGRRRLFNLLRKGPWPRKELKEVMGLSLRSLNRWIGEVRGAFLRFRSRGGGR